MSRKSVMDVSVIVAFRNAERYLQDLFESLTTQTIDEPWELIVVDNRSTDRSRHVAEQYKSKLPMAIVDAPVRPNSAYARNVGVAASTSDKLLFIDADDTVNPDYIWAMARALREHELITSRVDSLTLNPDWVRAAHGTAWQAEGVDVFYGFLPAAGVNIGINRELYLALGGFPEDYACCEDTAFSWNAHLRRKIALHFVPDAVYCYRYRDTLPKLFRQSSQWGQASAQLFRQYRRDGMPERPVRAALKEWRAVIAALPRAGDRRERAPLVVRLGYCVGRVKGSLQHRVLFL